MAWTAVFGNIFRQAKAHQVPPLPCFPRGACMPRRHVSNRKWRRHTGCWNIGTTAGDRWLRSDSICVCVYVKGMGDHISHFYRVLLFIFFPPWPHFSPIFWFWEIICRITVPLRPHGMYALLSCLHVKITCCSCYMLLQLLFIRIGQVSEYKLSAGL